MINQSQLKAEISSLHSLLISQQRLEETGASSSSFKASRITRYKIERLQKKLNTIENKERAQRVTKEQILANSNITSVSVDALESLEQKLRIKNLLLKNTRALVIDCVIKNDYVEARAGINERKRLEKEIQKIKLRLEKLCLI